MPKSERLQILIEPERLDQLRHVASVRKVSVATVVRDAIAIVVEQAATPRRAALDRILAMEPLDVPDDPADLALLIDTEYA